MLLDVDSAKPATRPTGPSGADSAKALAEPAQFASRAVRAGDTVWVVGAPQPGDSPPWMSSGLVASTDSLVAIVERADHQWPPRDRGRRRAPALIGRRVGRRLRRRHRHRPLARRRQPDDLRGADRAPRSSIANDLRAHGYATHGALGINGINASSGPTVSGVVAGGPAARAGVHVGDVIDSVDNHEVYSMDDVMALVRHDRPGQPVD